MDDRQTKIREGAGLEDSRVNQEFVDFLNKWSSPVLLMLAVAALVWAGLQYLDRKKIERVNQAFSELESATQGGNPSPASLKTIAGEYKGVRSVPELALLTTADLYLNATVVGIEPGAETDPLTGLPVDESSYLDENRRANYLSESSNLLEQVISTTKGVAGKELIAMQAMSRLAAVREGQRNFDGAKGVYEELQSFADSNQYPSIAAFAVGRIENLTLLNGLEPLVSEDQVLPLPGFESDLGLIDDLLNNESDDSAAGVSGQDPSEDIVDGAGEESGNNSGEAPEESSEDTESP